MTDAFPEDVEPEFWQVTRDGPGAVATSENLYALSQSSTDEGAQTRYRSKLSRITPTGEATWTVDIEAATADIRAAGDTVYYFRGEGPFDRVTERVAAHETETSEQRWLEGVQSHPTFVGTTANAVFVGSTNDDPYELPVRALEAADGQQRWQEVTAMPRGGVVSHGLCLVHGHPHNVIALEAATGDRSWEKTVGTKQRPGGIDRLDVVGDTLFLQTDEGARAYELPGGQHQWTWEGRVESASLHGQDAGYANTIFLGGRDGTISVIDVQTADVAWSQTPSVEGESDWVRGIAQADETVVARKWGTLYGFDAADGTELWRQVLSPVERIAGPTVLDETVFVLHAPTADRVEVKAYDIRSGRKKWRYALDRSDNLLPGTTVFEDRFVVAQATGELYGFSS